MTSPVLLGLALRSRRRLRLCDGLLQLRDPLLDELAQGRALGAGDLVPIHRELLDVARIDDVLERRVERSSRLRGDALVRRALLGRQHRRRTGLRQRGELLAELGVLLDLSLILISATTRRTPI